MGQLVLSDDVVIVASEAGLFGYDRAMLEPRWLLAEGKDWVSGGEAAIAVEGVWVVTPSLAQAAVARLHDIETGDLLAESADRGLSAPIVSTGSGTYLARDVHTISKLSSDGEIVADSRVGPVCDVAAGSDDSILVSVFPDSAESYGSAEDFDTTESGAIIELDATDLTEIGRVELADLGLQNSNPCQMAVVSPTQIVTRLSTEGGNRLVGIDTAENSLVFNRPMSAVCCQAIAATGTTVWVPHSLELDPDSTAGVLPRSIVGLDTDTGNIKYQLVVEAPDDDGETAVRGLAASGGQLWSAGGMTGSFGGFMGPTWPDP